MINQTNTHEEVGQVRDASPISQRVKRADILGIPIDTVKSDEAAKLICGMAMNGSPHHVVTVNPEFVMIAQHNAEFREVLRTASLALPDGIGIVWASKILGQSVSERVTGVDTVLAIARVARANDLSLFLLGAAPGIAERTSAILQQMNPGLKIAGTFSGSPNPHDEDEICAMIRAARPHILLVAYGPPKQDLWIARTQKRICVPVAMGVGGTFDFIAGVAKRAPVWIRKVGLEWLHRLIREPYRWRRMLTLPEFAFAVMKMRVRRSLLNAGDNNA